MSDTTVLTRPKPRRRRKIDAAMRERLEAAIEALVDTLDALDAPAEDLEIEHEGEEPDLEPSLGSTEQFSHVMSWKYQPYVNLLDGELDLGMPGFGPDDQTFRETKLGNRDDLEHCDSDREACESDFEDDSHDGREPDVDGEPSLGATNDINQQVAWQVTWEQMHFLDAELDDADLETCESENAK